jgi:fucose permease
MHHFLLLAVIYFAFISLGLPDSVLGVAWPTIRVTLGQPLEAAGMITFVLTVCGAISSFSSAFVLKRLGTGPVVIISGLLTGLALLGYSFAPAFGLLLLLAVPLGLGSGAVDAALNHFVARHYSSRHMNWLHGCWGIGATLGPVIMGAALVSAAGWTQGYRTIAYVQLVLAFVFLMTLPLWKKQRTSHDLHTQHDCAIQRKPLHPKATWLAALLFLFYSTIEVGTGLWAASVLVEERQVSAVTAGLWVSCFFGAIMSGRFATGLVAARLGNRKLVRYGVLMAIVGATLFSINGLPAALSLMGILLLGLGCAPIFPSLMHETVRRFDADTARVVIGRQMGLANVGAALGPAALGVLAGAAGPVFIMPVITLVLVALLVFSEVLNRIT